MKRREVLSTGAGLAITPVTGAGLSSSESSPTGWAQFGGSSRNVGYTKTTPTASAGASHTTINTLQDLGDIHNIAFDDEIPWWDLKVRRLVMTKSTILYTGPLNNLEDTYEIPHSATGGVVAIDRKTGNKKWEFSEFPQPFDGGVAVSDGIVVGLQPKNTTKFTSENLNFDYEGGYIYGIDLETGQKAWRTSFKGEPEHPPVSVDGTTYAVAGHHNIGKSQEELKRHQIIAVDNETGEVKWEITDNPELYRNVNNLGLTPAADSDGLFFTFGGSEVAKITLDGNLDWCTTIDSDAHHRNMGPPALDERYVYGVHDFLEPRYYRINKRTGEVDYLKSLNIGLPRVSVARPALTADSIYITATATGYADQESHTSSVLKIDKSSGNIEWETKIGNWVTAPLTVTSNAIFTSTAVVNRFVDFDQRTSSSYLENIDNKIIALERNTGNKIYSLDLDYHPVSELLADENGICFLDYKNMIHKMSDGKDYDTRKIVVPDPTIKLNKSSKTRGGGMTVNASAADSNANSTVYEWRLDGKNISSNKTNISLSLDETGDHNISLIAISDNGNVGSASKTVTVDSQTEVESRQPETVSQQAPSGSETSASETVSKNGPGFGILSSIISGVAGSYWLVRSQINPSSEDARSKE
ncbi:PQQ-binding-like beta-propeller repeat protein [Haloarcula sebkhae]|nr:PQQ-binding-like beta-propeller repeat protein [Haloarcula sebkhae]